MPTDIFFSVILPTYNRAHMLSTAIQSVLNQTFSNWELLIVDDGSTDKTKDIVGKFSDPRIRYEYKEHEERSIARNKGVKLSKGSYLCFLDSDDWFLPNHLQSHYSILKERSFPVIGIFSDSYIETNGYKKPYPQLFEGTNIIRRLWEIGYNLLPFSFHRTMLPEEPFDPLLNYMEDLDLLLLLLGKYEIFPSQNITNVVHNHGDRSIVLRYKNNLVERGKENIFCLDRIVSKHESILTKNLSTRMILKKRNDLIQSFLISSIRRVNPMSFLFFLYKRLIF